MVKRINKVEKVGGGGRGGAKVGGAVGGCAVVGREGGGYGRGVERELRRGESVK